MNVAREALQVVEGLFGAQVPGHEDVMNPARHQQLLKLAGDRLWPESSAVKTKTISINPDSR